VLATEPEGWLAAIVDFTFNLGAGRLQTSTLRRRVNQRDWTATGLELRRWFLRWRKGIARDCYAAFGRSRFLIHQ
jgi:GH24 family phage-related lysozyme (muramidase)